MLRKAIKALCVLNSSSIQSCRNMVVYIVVFTGTLQLHCKFGYCHKMSSVCLSVCRPLRKCIVTKQLQTRAHFFYWKAAKGLNWWHDKFDKKVR